MNEFPLAQIDRIKQILSKTTVQCRKQSEMIKERKVGEIKPGVPAMIYREVFDMPTENQLEADNIAMVDLHFVKVAVQLDIVEDYREEIDKLLLEWPQPDRLAAGLNFLEIGKLLHNQESALQFMALGEIMGYWEVSIPTMLGYEGDIANIMASQGHITVTGWKPS